MLATTTILLIVCAVLFIRTSTSQDHT